MVMVHKKSAHFNTHLGDPLHEWEAIQKDDTHARYMVAVYNPAKDAVEVHAKGGDHKKISSREECLRRVRDLYLANIPCWGGYSFKSVKNQTPGEKQHHMRFAGFLLWPQHHHIEWQKFQGIQNCKAKVKSRVFKNCDVFVEVHNFEDIYGEDHWVKHQQAAGSGAVHCDFGGGDKIHGKPVRRSKQTLSEQIANKAEQSSRSHNQKFAHALAEEERERRMMELARMEVAAESERMVNEEVAKSMMDKEQKSRVAEHGKALVGSEEGAVRHSLLMKEMFSSKHVEHMDERTRRSHRRDVNDLVEAHHEEVTRNWHKLDDEMLALRKKLALKAFLQAQDEQSRREGDHHGEYQKAVGAKRVSAMIHDELADAVHDMERVHHKRASINAMEEERARRVELAAHPTSCPGTPTGGAKKKMLFGHEVRGGPTTLGVSGMTADPCPDQAARRSQMHDEMVKVVQIIQEHDAMGNLLGSTTTTTYTTHYHVKQKPVELLTATGPSGKALTAPGSPKGTAKFAPPQRA